MFTLFVQGYENQVNLLAVVIVVGFFFVTCQSFGLALGDGGTKILNRHFDTISSAAMKMVTYA